MSIVETLRLRATLVGIDDRTGCWGCTASGQRFWPLDPRPADFDIHDIAHALAAVNRFNGHTRLPYSVAEHSVHVSYECCAMFALDGLLHDASEAYLGDVCRPLKQAEGMEAYGIYEDHMMDKIATRFGFAQRGQQFWQMPECVKRADEQLLATEARDLMPQDGPGGVREWRLSHEPLPHLDLSRPWSPRVAKRRFLRRYRQLVGLDTWRDRLVIRLREMIGLRGCA
jgi:hypothetical protein